MIVVVVMVMVVTGVGLTSCGWVVGRLSSVQEGSCVSSDDLGMYWNWCLFNRVSLG